MSIIVTSNGWCMLTLYCSIRPNTAVQPIRQYPAMVFEHVILHHVHTTVFSLTFSDTRKVSGVFGDNKAISVDLACHLTETVIVESIELGKTWEETGSGLNPEQRQDYSGGPDYDPSGDPYSEYDTGEGSAQQGSGYDTGEGSAQQGSGYDTGEGSAQQGDPHSGSGSAFGRMRYKRGRPPIGVRPTVRGKGKGGIGRQTREAVDSQNATKVNVDSKTQSCTQAVRRLSYLKQCAGLVKCTLEIAWNSTVCLPYRYLEVRSVVIHYKCKATLGKYRVFYKSTI